jgi:asparagine synthase (glutamine-hydrolysing)
MNECLYLASGHLPEALRIYDLLFNTLADRYLTKIDKASMYHSIEVRAPFLDFRFVELSLRIPESYKFKLGKSKILFKEYIKTFFPKVPTEIIDRKKKGFTPPIRNWITEELNYGINQNYLNILEEIYPGCARYYSELLKRHTLNAFELEQIIKLRLFLDWFGQWIGNSAS